jgi:hypothetical protein
MNEEAAEPALRKIEGVIEGFFWMLPNLGIALVVFTLFVVAAGVANRAVRHLAQRRDRGDLGILLGGFTKWATVLLGLPRNGAITHVIVGRSGFLGLGRDYVAVPWKRSPRDARVEHVRPQCA